MSGIFISYRREDSSAHAGRLSDKLSQHFRDVFMDVNSIEAGQDFVEVLERTLNSSAVMVVVIGKRWLAAADNAGRRRLDKEDDFVRLEIATALNRRIPLIPVLVSGADMPTESDLPDVLKPLARRQAVRLHDDQFHSAVKHLIEAIRSAQLVDADVAGAVPAAESDPRSTLLHGRAIKFAGASAALVKHVRLREFSSLIEERSRNFVGRKSIIGQIEQYLKDPEFPYGYIAITGEPGVGKTALLSWLVKQEGYVHHFNIALQDIRSAKDFLANVCAQLIIQYDLNYKELPVDATANSLVLSNLIKEASDKNRGAPLVILVDALDEALEEGGVAPNRLYLPSTLPVGVFIVVTARHKKDLRLEVDRIEYLDFDDEQFRDELSADIKQYVRNYVERHGAEMLARIGQWAISETEFEDIIVRDSEGNFMYVVHVLRDIFRGKITKASLTDISKLPKGLEAYYRRHWRSMRAVDELRFEQYYKPVLAMLAVAQEPVSVSQLVEWNNALQPAGEAVPARLTMGQVQEVIGDWREFLNEVKSEQYDSRYHLYHYSFQEFLAREVGLVPYHGAVVETALDKIRGW